MNFTGVIFHTVLIGAVTVFQSIVLKNGIIAGVTPDFALLILVLSANQHGSLKGQGSGFAAGLLQDFLSITPLGFHALSRTVIGYLFGAFKGKIFIDPLLIPILFAVIATAVKALLGYVTLAVFSPNHAETVFSLSLVIEIGLNAIIAPFLFGLLKLLKLVRFSREEL